MKMIMIPPLPNLANFSISIPPEKVRKPNIEMEHWAKIGQQPQVLPGEGCFMDNYHHI